MSGVLGFYNIENASQYMVHGLHTLQHRGLDGAGIITSDGTELYGYKNMGMVQEVFNQKIIAQLGGKHALGNVYHPHLSRQTIQNIQPFLFNHTRGDFAVCNHGKVVNAKEIRKRLELNGSIFQSDSDSELLAHLLNINYEKRDVEGIIHALNFLEGSFAFAYLTPTQLFGMRDRLGLATLSLGKLRDGYVLSSETCVFDTIGAEFVREVLPGEIVCIDDKGVHSFMFSRNEKRAIHAMEYIFYSRPDSNIAGVNVHQARKACGVALANAFPSSADIVVGVPNSSLSAAYGYAEASGLPYEMGLVKNRYINKSLTGLKSVYQEQGVRIKLSTVKSVLYNRRVVLIDDSIIRGTTARHLVQMIRNAGATEVHLRIASPPIISAQMYGLNNYSDEDLISRKYTKEALRDSIGADSLEFLSVEDLKNAIGIDDLYVGCFNEVFPLHQYEQKGEQS